MPSAINIEVINTCSSLVHSPTYTEACTGARNAGFMQRWETSEVEKRMQVMQPLHCNNKLFTRNFPDFITKSRVHRVHQQHYPITSHIQQELKLISPILSPRRERFKSLCVENSGIFILQLPFLEDKYATFSNFNAKNYRLRINTLVKHSSLLDAATTCCRYYFSCASLHLTTSSGDNSISITTIAYSFIYIHRTITSHLTSQSDRGEIPSCL